jgi:hypothetical protein
MQAAARLAADLIWMMSCPWRTARTIAGIKAKRLGLQYRRRSACTRNQFAAMILKRRMFGPGASAAERRCRKASVACSSGRELCGGWVLVFLLQAFGSNAAPSNAHRPSSPN